MANSNDQLSGQDSDEPQEPRREASAQFEVAAPVAAEGAAATEPEVIKEKKPEGEEAAKDEKGAKPAKPEKK